ncbi:complement C1q tumor necrosis factor-related protein 2-like [Orbicella faveolata]|uniref:complement C1q tumor necrosis factor-related protein 2-like n=1 Tax=Orbicella faveolata TaxID=48498 RepID=UPI0009E3C494|nr:complement C1q tumor necrosis factor-related protein 2-like [Orbicella faveolata]
MKMFRFFFVLALAFFLSSFAISQKKSPNETNGTEAKQNLCAVAPQVVCGKDGKDGKDGQNGKDGRDGLNGKDGRDGRDGTRGPKDGNIMFRIVIRS